jgi:hypothetical protein
LTLLNVSLQKWCSMLWKWHAMLAIANPGYALLVVGDPQILSVTLSW